MFYHNLNPVLLDIGPIEIRYYGIFYAFGFFLAYFMIPYIAKKKGLGITKDDAADFLLYAIIGVVGGARVVYVLFYNFQYFIQSPLEIFALWQGGLSFHGGFIGAVLAGYIFCRKKRINFMDFVDVLVVPVALALALGRIGNFVNGELYGRITDVSFCIDYSKNEFLAQLPEGCRHPSQIYSFMKNLLIFGVLWSIKSKKLPKGFSFWLFIAMYGLLRTIVEFFRQPDEQLGFVLGSLSMGQLLSIPMFIVGLYMLFRAYNKKAVD